VDAWLYRAALHLYPPAFRHEFMDEMVHDFEEARAEARAAGSRDLWRFHLRLVVDLSRSLPLQWFRSGLPLIAALSALVPLSATYLIARALRRFVVVMPAPSADAEAIGLVLLASVTIALIAMTIVLTLWFAHPLVSRRRP
jgi:hypothetical protein